jgi:hypothetical protein
MKLRCLVSGSTVPNHHWSLFCIFVVSGLRGFDVTAQDLSCTSALGDVQVRGNLNIAASCQLTGTDVRGNVTLFSGGSLIARDVRIRGNLESRRADFVAIEDSRIDGNVDLDELVGDSSSIKSAEIDGNVSLTSNRSALEILNNEIDGNVRASRNTGGLSLSGNSIDGNLDCSGNTPAPVGIGNRVDDDIRGQCRNLRQHENDREPPAASPPTATPPSAGGNPPATPTTSPPTGMRPPATPTTSPPSGARPPPATPPPAGPVTPTNPPSTATPPAGDNVGSRDTAPPTLTLRGAPSVKVTINSTYVDAGATATDATDGDLTSRIQIDNPVNTALLGTFTVTYSVSDRSGNVAKPVTRTVTVEPADATGGGGGGAFDIEIALALLLIAFGRARCASRITANGAQPPQWRGSGRAEKTGSGAG